MAVAATPRPRLHEVIVVEGRGDVVAVLRAVEAQVLTTGGFGFPDDAMGTIAAAHRRCGIVVLTDPDAAGAAIRRRIAEAVGPCRHAHLPREACERDGDVGVENASPEAIRAALLAARPTLAAPGPARFGVADLVAHGLTGTPGSAARRRRLAERLSLGRADARQLLRRLEAYGVTREEFEAAVGELPPMA